MYKPVQHACPGTSLLMGDSTITVAGVVSGITAITPITLSLSACPGYQYAHVLCMDASPASPGMPASCRDKPTALGSL